MWTVVIATECLDRVDNTALMEIDRAFKVTFILNNVTGEWSEFP